MYMVLPQTLLDCIWGKIDLYVQKIASHESPISIIIYISRLNSFQVAKKDQGQVATHW